MASKSKVKQTPSLQPLETKSDIHKNLDLINISDKIKSEFITEFPKSPNRIKEESVNSDTTIDFTKPPLYERFANQQTTIDVESNDAHLSLPNALSKPV
jgi:hypothetical protein